MKVFNIFNFTILLLFIISVGCKNKSIRQITTPNPEIIVAAYGNEKSDTIIIYAQGGPVLEEDHYFTKILASALGTSYYYVLPYQVQTKNPNTFQTEIDFENAKKEASKSTRMLSEAVKFFQKQKKTVYVIGISYGAFVVTDMLAEYGNIADKNVILVGRLNMPKEVWKEFAKGNPMGFVEGEQVVNVTLEEAGMGGDSEVSDRNMMRLAAGLGHKDYMKLITTENLSNVLYIFGGKDEQVGKLNEKETEFLKTRQAVVLEIEGAYHMDVVMSSFLEIKQFLGLETD